MRGGADSPPNESMDDPECEALVNILRHLILLTDWADIASIAGTIVTWFERHSDVSFYSIPLELPPDMLRLLLTVLEAYVLLTDDADDGAKAGRILKALKTEV